MFWTAMLRNILRRCHHRIALRRPERDRDHVLFEMLAIAHAGVEAVGDDIDERAVADDLQFDLRICLQERRDHRRQHQIDRRRRRIDAQASRRHAAQATHLIERIADIRHRRPDAGQQQLAGLGQPDAAGGAVHQADAEPLLEVAQPLAQAGNRDALFHRGAPEIPGAGDGDEGIEIAQVEIAHCSIY